MTGMRQRVLKYSGAVACNQHAIGPSPVHAIGVDVIQAKHAAYHNAPAPRLAVA